MVSSSPSPHREDKGKGVYLKICNLCIYDSYRIIIICSTRRDSKRKKYTQKRIHISPFTYNTLFTTQYPQQMNPLNRDFPLLKLTTSGHNKDAPKHNPREGGERRKTNIKMSTSESILEEEPYYKYSTRLTINIFIQKAMACQQSPENLQ